VNSSATNLHTEPEFNLQDDGNCVFLTVFSNAANAPVSVAWLMQHLANSRYVHAKIDPVAITYWVKSYNAGYQSDKKVIVAKLINAQCEIKIDSEAMSAYLYITPAMGGADITRRDIIAAIIASRIINGIVNRSITEALQAPNASKLLIAKGKLPKHGKDSTFEMLVPGWSENFIADDSTNLSPQPSLFEDERYEGESYVFDSQPIALQNKTLLLVEPGDTLLIRQSETSGTDGKDIFGNTVAGYQGKQILFSERMLGVSVCLNDPNVLVATIHGHVVPDNNVIKVLPVTQIDLIDTSTGNINFNGSIHIKGNVSSDMQVQAQGDIYIEGRIEHGAYIQAGGDIVVKKGVFGKIPPETLNATTIEDADDNNEISEHQKVEILCRGDIYTLSMQHTKVRTENSLYVSNSITQCDINVGKKVIAGNMFSDTATIDGGTVQAKYLIRANILGSPDAVLTRLQVGGTQTTLAQASLLKSEIIECENKRSVLEKKLAQCSLLNVCDGAAKNDKSATLHYLNNELLELTHLLISYRIEREICLTELLVLQHANIQGDQDINPNLRIKIANHSQTIRNAHPAGRFVLHQNNIDFDAS